jgi:methylmalonyl-CoA/ethylmalonyl-CoA epimerase
MSLDIFKELHHICIVVSDLDRAVKYYESVGIGPWLDYPPLDGFTAELDVPDHAAFLRLKYRYANLDNIQIQLCEPGEGGSPQRRFLETRGEGVYHLGFGVDDCDAAEAHGIAAGLRVGARGRRPDRTGFTYFDTREDAGVTLEVRTPKSK